MERVMQYLDDLEDFVCAVALAAGRIIRAIQGLAVMMVSVALQIGALLLALAQPPLGLAVASILSVTLLYRTVVSHHPRITA
jgi:hypothetical protein